MKACGDQEQAFDLSLEGISIFYFFFPFKKNVNSVNGFLKQKHFLNLILKKYF